MVSISLRFLGAAVHFLPLVTGQELSAASTGNGTQGVESIDDRSLAGLAATAACVILDAFLGKAITLPRDAQYTALSDVNWSQNTWKHPSCIAQPTSTADLQKIVTTLTFWNVPFAIRSGGHNPNEFAANIDTGVLISMDKFNSVTYNKAQGTATFGTGGRWKAVYDTLDPYNVTVVGGRVLDVGVGGLTLGSGLSYLSDLYGLVCDNVVSYDVSVIIYYVNVCNRTG